MQTKKHDQYSHLSDADKSAYETFSNASLHEAATTIVELGAQATPDEVCRLFNSKMEPHIREVLVNHPDLAVALMNDCVTRQSLKVVMETALVAGNMTANLGQGKDAGVLSFLNHIVRETSGHATAV